MAPTFHYSIGRRKKSTAKVFLPRGTGYVLINNKPASIYLQHNWGLVERILKPLQVLGLQEDYDVIATVHGGGLHAQGEAIALSVAKLLSTLLPEKRRVLKQSVSFTRDSRVKERKKFGLRKARKAPQFSKR